MPLDVEDATPPDNPARALTRKETTNAQKQQAEMMQPPRPMPQPGPNPNAGRPADSPSGVSAEAQGKDNAQPQQAKEPASSNGQPQPAPPDTAQAPGQPKAGLPSAYASLPPELQQYYAKVAENPWLPFVNEAEFTAEMAWNVAHHVGSAINAFFDPNAQAVSQQSIWSRNDALAKLVQLAEAGPYGQFNHGQSEWFWENIGPMLTSMPAYVNPLSGTVLFGLSLAGSGPEKVGQVPGAVKAGLPIAEIGTVAQHPEAIKDPALASRLFWKMATGALIGASVLPMTSWIKGLKIIDPKRLEELTQTAAKIRAAQPGDPNLLPEGKALMDALKLPPMTDTSLVAKGATRDIRQMEMSPTGEYSDLTARQRTKIQKALGISSFEDLPHAVPDWTPAQVKLARKVLPGWLPYDLTRKHSGDVVPEDPYLFFKELADEHLPSAERYMAAFNYAHLQILRGPVLDPLNAAESMVHSLPATHTGTRFVMEKLHTAQAELMEKAGLNDKELMRAIRDPEAYAKLSPAAKMIVNAQKILRRVYADQSRMFGHREGFVPNYDPRVKVQEEAPIQGAVKGGRGAKALTSESKAHREEQFIVNPDDPAQIALAEKYPDVFALNAEMSRLRKEHIANATKSGRQRLLEDSLNNGRDNPIGALRAITKLNEMEGKWDAPSAEALAAATLSAIRRYPMYYEGLHEASLRSLERQVMALHSKIALPQVLNALAHDGNPLAFERSAREIPAGYKKLENASPVFDNYVFHPDFANPLNRIASSSEPHGLYGAWVKTNELSVAALMFAPMIHGDNLAGRVAWLLSKHALDPKSGVVGQTQAAMAHTKPWAMLEQVLGVKHGTEMERVKWQMAMEMQAINAGVIPHFPSQGLTNLLFSQYGRAQGDITAFERPGTREAHRLPPAFQGIEGAARAVGNGYEALQNFLWGRIVWPSGVFAFHVERAAAKAAHPELPDLVIDQMAAHMANRWQGAIEPMARSQAMNTLWRATGFAINWVRSFYELALPSYLSKSAVAAHPELRGYILRQELQSLMGMMMAQHLSGNIMNMILSGHPQWENDPQNKFSLEITRPEIIRGLQSIGLYKNVDAATGRDPATGGKLQVENPLARQQLQMERMLGMEEGVTPTEGAQYMLAGHLALLIPSLAASFNVNLPQSVIAGTPRYIDQSDPKMKPPWEADPLAVILQYLGVGSTLGRQAQFDASGRPVDTEQMPDWLKNAPVPDAIKRYAAPGGQQTWNWLTGIRAPYVKPEKTEGTAVSDQNYVAFTQLSETYKKDMNDWSNQLMQGKITPYEWRQRYSARAHDYSIRLDQLFTGASEYKQGALGLYSGYQKLYNDAQLPDGTGIDWGKLDGLQADYMQNLTGAQQADLQTEIDKHENAYPALGMYRATLNAHTQMAKEYAQSQGISYGTLMSELDAARHFDNIGYKQYVAQHPELGQYFQAQTQWEINTWPGRLYSLYYHTSALAKWLIPTESATGPAAEEKAAQDIAQHFHAPVAAS